ncbi:hypothetical protein [Pelagicoccus albus]|uniref:Uncharacterized protein n=1 Tax=Pelagicoccus albus TaxID=415222 RepID=A0A7X1B7I4_9BACT|nr:hypothetical protein [Pelagicoccus albus]MBC2606992.1 hypothetical protein [Pelagicoccus albus]
MTDTTTARDLAKKIEWVGLRNLSHTEKLRVGEDLVGISCYLPRLIALALWSFYGQTPPDYLITRGSESSLDTYRERERSKSYISELMADYRDED